MRVFIAVIIGKLVKLFCRVVKRGGTAKPGVLALKVCPELLMTLSKGVRCIVVTGSNGKTTSCRMVEKGFEDAGLDYFANRSGANLIEGIATDFIVNSTVFGKCRKKYAVLETDEAACKEVCRQIRPEVIFVTNIFVDQVDRFGGVENTRDWILSGAKNAPDAVLCLNADDSVSVSISRLCSNRCVFYGIEGEAVEERTPGGFNDVENCIMCGEKLEYSYMTFSHLGGFRCPKCGYERPAAQYSVTAIPEEGLDHSDMVLRGERLRVNLPAMYNIYNAAGTVAALENMGISTEIASGAVASFSGGFGRMEKLKLGNSGAMMILVKNGAGCDQVINFLSGTRERFNLVVYLNNNVSDGVDIGWINDVKFESLKSCPVEKVYVSGMRCDEMYQRLVKAGLEDRLIREKDLNKLISDLNESEIPIFILPTYTGMMQMRTEIIRRYGGTQFWDI